MISLKISCPHCGQSFMDSSRQLDEKPSVRFSIDYKGKRGALYLSSLYGSYKIDCELDIPEGDVVEFFCPNCETNLKGTRVCEVCGADMVTMMVVAGGKILICSRKGCKKHLLEFEDLNTELQMFYESTGL